MLIDGIILVFVVSSLLRGREIGFVRQTGSTAGFFGGLFLGAWLEPHTVGLAHSSIGRTLVTLLTTLGCALLLMAAGEYLGFYLKRRLATKMKRINVFDNWFGALVGAVWLLLSAWLIAAILSSLPFPSLQAALHGSRIIGTMNRRLPPAPALLADLGHLIDPHGFPQVFVGNEPSPPGSVNLPTGSDLAAAVSRDRASVVKIEGQGCGGIIEGSGFVVGANDVATNAHVVAGISQPYVADGNGLHKSAVIWFDPNLDLAVLRVSNLARPKLSINTKRAAPGTPAAVLGYPGGGPFTADPAAVLDEIIAIGRNIYGRGETNRDIYEVQANVIPGNSGGPLIDNTGAVIGVVFAESETYQHVGYALTSSQVSGSIAQAISRNQAASTGQCAE